MVAGRTEATFQKHLAGLRDAESFHSRAARLEQIKQEMAVAGSKLLAEPAENLPQLRLLLELGLDSDPHVRPSDSSVMYPCAGRVLELPPDCCEPLGQCSSGSRVHNTDHTRGCCHSATLPVQRCQHSSSRLVLRCRCPSSRCSH